MTSQNIHAIIMPNKVCNLACTYCYVLAKPSQRMSSTMAEQVVDKLLDHNIPSKPTRFIWHGGEPMLAGRNFYQYICSYIRTRYPHHMVEHYIQTNGMLLDEAWIDLFLQEDFKVGVSLDGYREIHDSCRITRGGSGSFDKIFKNIMLARKKGLIVGTLSVITRQSLGHEEEIFRFFYENRLDFGFHPITALTPDMDRDLAITPQEFADVSIKLFDLGFYQPEPRVTSVAPTLHYVLAVMMGCASGFCVLSEACASEYISVEPSGNVHVCDRFAGNSQLCFGNIAEDSLEEILQSPVRQAFLERWRILRDTCGTCQWAAICHGGCPHEAFAKTGSIFQPDPNCEAYQRIFQHVSDTISLELRRG